jgi:hypothetical protein
MLKQLASQLKECTSYLDQLDVQNLEVSQSTVGWQIDHLTMVIEGVLKALNASDPQNYRYQFNLTRLVIFTLGRIPRGKAKAPKVVQPKTVATREDLEKRITAIHQLLETSKALAPNANFEHPYFGLLNKKGTFKFLKIHSEHHLKIVRDMLKSQ